jgi:hypothetical protein
LSDSSVSASAVIAGLAVGIGLIVIFGMFPQSSFLIDTPPGIVIPKGADPNTMPDDFAILYSIDRVSIGPVLDTKNNLYTQDMVCDPDIQIRLVLSDTELQRIWETIVGNDFFTLPEDLTKKCDESRNDVCIMMIPSYKSVLNITAYGQSHAVKFSSAFLIPNDKHLAHYGSIQDTIWSTVQSREEVMELPKLRCGYA